MPLHKEASSWALESIVESEKLGLIPKELYPLRYKEPITREEFSSLIVKLHELTTGKEMKLKRWQVFYDVDESNPYRIGLTACGGFVGLLSSRIR